ncbi:MAG: ribosomal S27a family protein [Nanoarchaeota archaeon]|nr:ribosomal S27a family protein [Nanoarchaeota archaeon]
MAKGPKAVKKGKKPHKNKPTSKKYTKYKIGGDKISRARSCPRCGPGIFVSESKGRIYCGKCHYAEVLESKKPEAVETKSAR